MEKKATRARMEMKARVWYLLHEVSAYLKVTNEMHSNGPRNC
jgi:hypothetical protein